MKFKENILAVAALQPNYLGFIFYEKSARFFDGEIPLLPKSIKKVGVFVNASQDYILKRVKKYNLQTIQLHGSESPEFCKTLKDNLEIHLEQNKKISKQHSNPIEIIKVFSIKEAFNFKELQPYEKRCDYYLFDTKGKLPGGNGYTFNWEVLKDYPSTKPYFLSGGIGLDEVDDMISFLSKEESKYCYAIDVNSKFEIEAGLKDEEKIKTFKEIVSI